MRFGYTLLLAGALSLGIGIQAQTDDFIPQKAGNVTISLPSGWEVLPKGAIVTKKWILNQTRIDDQVR